MDKCPFCKVASAKQLPVPDSLCSNEKWFECQAKGCKRKFLSVLVQKQVPIQCPTCESFSCPVQWNVVRMCEKPVLDQRSITKEYMQKKFQQWELLRSCSPEQKMRALGCAYEKDEEL